MTLYKLQTRNKGLNIFFLRELHLNRGTVSIQAAERAKKELEAKKEAYKRLKRECQKQKQWIAEYQLLIRAGASGSHKVHFVDTLGYQLLNFLFYSLPAFTFFGPSSTIRETNKKNQSRLTCRVDRHIGPRFTVFVWEFEGK